MTRVEIARARARLNAARTETLPIHDGESLVAACHAQEAFWKQTVEELREALDALDRVHDLRDHMTANPGSLSTFQGFGARLDGALHAKVGL